MGLAPTQVCLELYTQDAGHVLLYLQYKSHFLDTFCQGKQENLGLRWFCSKRSPMALN